MLSTLLDSADFWVKIGDQLRLQVREFIHSVDGNNKGKKEHQSVLRRVLDLAIEDGQLTENPAGFQIKLPREIKQDVVEPYPPEEMSALLYHSQGDLQNYLGIAFSTGARPEEVIALQISDIDLENQILHIERAISKGKLKPTKTGERRTIRIFDSALPYFRQQLKVAYERKTLWLFSKEDGERLDDIEQIRKKNNRKNSFYSLCQRLNIRFRAIKQTRHTFAVNAIISQQLTLQELTAFLGHKDLRMVINHYAKWIDRERVAKIEKGIDMPVFPTPIFRFFTTPLLHS